MRTASAQRTHTFLSPNPTIFQVASVIIESDSELALVDAQFSRDNALRLVEKIRKIDKPLRTIFISYSDPDYYFGLDVIARAFPDAKILATPQTVWTIGATKDEKMAIWAPQLGENAPEKIVVPDALAPDHFMVGRHRVEICSNAGDEAHSWLWLPDSRTVLGGIYLTDNQHLWVADSQSNEAREKWLAALDTMAASNPKKVIPAHFYEPLGSDPIGFTKRYLTELDKVLKSEKSSTEVITAMEKRYPSLAAQSNLEMTTKVLTGEMAWKTVDAFEAIGRKVEVDFGGEYLFELDFTDNHTMTFRGLKPRAEGRPITDTVQYTAVEVAPRVYMVYWTERDNTHVVHVEDYGAGVAYTNIASPDGSFTNLKGTLKMSE